MGKLKMLFKFKIGDIVSAQGAKLKIIRRFAHEGLPAYEVRSPFTQGEGWLVLEEYLMTARRVRTKVFA